MITQMHLPFVKKKNQLRKIMVEGKVPLFFSQGRLTNIKVKTPPKATRSTWEYYDQEVKHGSPLSWWRCF